ncbi:MULTISPECIES: GNAT family protein [Lysinibacillus]|uniref:N-acetyltransferase n=1 Tax=Lysinibacillus fusiformis TaxID=28031 RepID=A0A2I0V040_9BACI|nr:MULTISPECIES: GNAT family protein [Lysinibacillus]KUF35777.1 acetyltransferase [Lysinibacillus sp. F5]MEE3806324.1 GNAT family protein [Lysinibacillus fusiformis]PKU51660.1 N-acetyltransferase [Lysinibacillus fusiformis]SCY34574.1 Acetyltransferase (GNAT) domain-containing protein [Lysinibacillus sp. SG9]SDB17787.1 Acetyltransferase (GNAT) domain-containing protein [Lysinibacillus sp. TC-37]
MQTTTSIELVHFSEDYAEQLNSFELPEEQHQFTALPKEITIEKVGQYPIVILSNHVPVGFFVLHATDRVKEYSSNPQAMLLTALSIDYQQQGKGYAKKAMFALADFVKQEFKECNEVVLVVNHKNTAAQHLYAKVGFVDHGERRIGPIGEQIVMNLPL